jgi:hypothetical protein
MQFSKQIATGPPGSGMQVLREHGFHAEKNPSVTL